MTASKDVARDHSEFILRAQLFWSSIKAGDSKQANAETRAGDDIVQEWAHDGRASEFLLPLLNNQSPAVRFAAAAHLMNFESKEQAVQVLRQLHSENQGLIGPSARLTLMRHGIPLKSTGTGQTQ